MNVIVDNVAQVDRRDRDSKQPGSAWSLGNDSLAHAILLDTHVSRKRAAAVPLWTECRDRLALQNPEMLTRR